MHDRGREPLSDTCQICISLPMLREALSVYLRTQTSVRSVAQTATLSALIDALDACPPDATVVLDADAVPRGNECLDAIVEAVTLLRNIQPGCRLIFLANSGWDEQAAIAAGADDVLRKGLLGSELSKIFPPADA